MNIKWLKTKSKKVEYDKGKCYKKSQDKSIKLQHIWLTVIQIQKGMQSFL